MVSRHILLIKHAVGLYSLVFHLGFYMRSSVYSRLSQRNPTPKRCLQVEVVLWLGQSERETLGCVAALVESLNAHLRFEDFEKLCI